MKKNDFLILLGMAIFGGLFHWVTWINLLPLFWQITICLTVVIFTLVVVAFNFGANDEIPKNQEKILT